MTLPDIETIQGLSSTQVSDRIRTFGYNELPEHKKDGIIDILLEVFKEPMFLLLVASGLIYFFLGDITEAVMLMKLCAGYYRNYGIPGAKD